MDDPRIEKIINLAREASKDKEHRHYYSFRDNKIISLGLNELDDYLNSENYEEVDELLEDILDDRENYFEIPSFNDEESFNSQMLALIDETGNLVVEAEENLQSAIYNLIHTIYSYRPFEYFTDTQYIIYKNDNSDENGYVVNLGHAKKTFGISFYIGEDGLVSMESLISEPYEDNYDYSEVLSFSQNCLTIYFEKPDENTEAYKQTLKYLGEDIAKKINYQIAYFDGHTIAVDILRQSVALSYFDYIESYVCFLKKYFDKDKIKYSSFKKNEYVEYRRVSENQVRYRKIYFPTNNHLVIPTFMDNLPILFDIQDIRKTSKIYEFKFMTLGNSYRDEANERILYYSPIVFLTNHKTGALLGINTLISKSKYYLFELFDIILDTIRREGLPKKIIVSTMFDASIIQQIFGDIKYVQFGNISKTEKYIEEILKLKDEEFDA